MWEKFSKKKNIKLYRDLIKYWIPVIILLGIIFWLSSGIFTSGYTSRFFPDYTFSVSSTFVALRQFDSWIDQSACTHSWIFFYGASSVSCFLSQLLPDMEFEMVSVDYYFVGVAGVEWWVLSIIFPFEKIFSCWCRTWFDWRFSLSDYNYTRMENYRLQ